MADAEFYWELGAFFACVALFELFERWRPARRIDRSRDFLFNAFAMTIVVVVGTAWKPAIVGGIQASGADRWLDAAGAPIRALGSVVKVLFGIILADVVLYWVHRAMHGSDILWRTHVFHHSVDQLYWLGGARTSVTHLFLYTVPQTLISTFLLLTTAGEAAAGFSFGIFANFWVHTNLTIPLGPLEPWVLTPQFHRLHHSRDMKAANFGAVLTVWDRMFGTYRDPRKFPDDYPLGLTTDENMPRMVVGV